MFKEFYEIVLNEIKFPNINSQVIELLAKENVYNDENFLFFNDVEPALNNLKDKYSLGVVSDTWPSLERVFINKNLRQYFSTFIMSSRTWGRFSFVLFQQQLLSSYIYVKNHKYL